MTAPNGVPGAADRFRDERRAALLGNPRVSGLDFVEAARSPRHPDRWRLRVRFLGPVPARLSGSQIALRGPSGEVDPGLRVGEIRYPERAGSSLEITVVVEDGERAERLAGDPREFWLELPGVALDRFFSSAPFRFDGRPPEEAAERALPAAQPERPDVDYLAKDYASFRRLMLDRLSTLAPQWRERNPADFGIALVELLSYVADHTSYAQDAVATEAYLGTARKRSSVRRHLRLLGYRLHEGTNARVWVRFEIEPTGSHEPLSLPAGSRLLTRAGDLAVDREPRPGTLSALDPQPADGLPTVIPYPSETYRQALEQGSLVFETMHAATLRPELGEIELYAWGVADYSLPAGATTVALAGRIDALEKGDALLLEQVRDPQTGEAEGSDPALRHVVRLAAPPRFERDPLTEEEITEIELFAEDALPFELPVRAVGERGALTGLAVARGNLVLADHGETVREALDEVPERGRFRPMLGHPNLSHNAPFDAGDAARRPAAEALRQSPREALPSLVLEEHGAGDRGVWRTRFDLLESGRFAPELVVETEEDGRARLRFGDGTVGRRPSAGTRFEAVYRIGNGPDGRIGPDALAHLVTDEDLPVRRVSNPLPSRGGRKRQPLERARLLAPRSFRRLRAVVVPADAKLRAEALPAVQSAAARWQWTGSWHTVFLHVQPRAGRAFDAELEAELRREIEPLLLADVDLEVRPPRPLPLEIRLRVRAARGLPPDPIRRGLLEKLTGRDGFFDPDRFPMGRALHLGQLIDAAMDVPGVAAAEAEIFRPRAAAPEAPAVWPSIEPGPFEAITVRNRAGAPETGTLTVAIEGEV